MSQDESLIKVTIPALSLDVSYQNWRLSIESALMTKGLIKYIQTALPPDAPTADFDKRTQAFGIILAHLSFSERLTIDHILTLGTHDAYALWNDIKNRHEKVTISRVWAYWKRLNAPPETTLSDLAAIDNWFTGTIAAYNSYKTSGRQIDEYTACMIMLDNLPEMWDAMRRSITQSGNDGNTMTFTVLRNNMESELIARKSSQPTADVTQALMTIRSGNNQQSTRRPPKRKRVRFQRTPGAQCTKCNKPNHTAQQCGKTIDDSEDPADGSAQLTSSAARPRTLVITRRDDSNNVNNINDDDYDSDELFMTTKDDDGITTALATIDNEDFEPPCRYWLLDSAASQNYCNDRSLLSRVRRSTGAVKLGNNQRLPIVAEGEVTLILQPHGQRLTITAKYVPGLRRNLLSTGALGRHGIHVHYEGPRAYIIHAQSGRRIGQARCINEGSELNLYRVDPIHDTSPLHSALVCQSNTDTEHDNVMLWHRRLGHSNVRRIQQLFTKGMTADGHALQNRIRPNAHQMQTTMSTTADGQEPHDRTRLNTKTADSQELRDRTRLSRNKTADSQELQDRTRLSTTKTADGRELQDRTRLSGNKTADGVELQDRTRLSTDKTADSQESQDRTKHNAQQMRQKMGTRTDSQELQIQVRPNAQQMQQDRHCDSCAICKHHAANRPHNIPDESRAKRPLEVIHMDLRGPHTAGINQELYHLLIVDECTRYTVGFTLKRKSDTLACFERFATAANNFHSAKGYSVQFIRTDNGGEFIGAEWERLLTELGIQRQLTAPHSPHQNGLVERLNRTIGEHTRAMLHAAGLPSRFWPLAAQASIYLHNRLPSKAIGDRTPYQLWRDKRPSIGHLRVFGCLAYALVHDPGKLDDKATRCTFVGYPLDSSRTYLLWDNQQRKLVRSGNVHFVESIMGFNYNPKATVGEATAGEAAAGEEQLRRALANSRAARANDAAPTPAELLTDITPTSTTAIESKEEQSEPRLNRKQRNELNRLRDALSPAINDAAPAIRVNDEMLNADRPQLRAGPGRHHYYGSIHTAQQSAESPNNEEPHTFTEAMTSPHQTEWLGAIRSELNSLIKAGTWRYAHKPTEANLVGCRWVFKIKRDKDGNISKFKARLVAQGFTQVYGIDYAETYAPVARYSSIRLIIALAAHYDWEIHQMDVKTAYLNGDLDVPIYMRSPQGLELIDQQCPANQVCLLTKSLYGLKQSGRQWHANINHSLLANGFTPLHADRCVYVRRKADSIVIIALYVDDLLIASSKTPELLSIKRKLAQQYEMEDMGEATFILGIDIKRNRSNRSISIGQSAYFNTLLQRHGMTNCKPVSTPMDPGATYELMAAADGYQASLTLTRDYQSIIGGLMFAAICTRPDIAFAVNRLARYCANPTQAHYTAAKRILRYMKGTIDYRINYTGTAEHDPQLVGYSDADWAQDKDGKRKSTSGYVFVVCGGAVSWQSKKQSSIALSSTEAELMAITSSTKELLWFRHHLGGIGLNRTQPTTLLIDSQCAMDIANNSKISERSKHIEVQHFFIREHIEAGTVRLQHVPSDQQVADTLTKPLSRVAFKRCADMLGLIPRNDKIKQQK
jgi:transposase InsO family protein